MKFIEPLAQAYLILVIRQDNRRRESHVPSVELTFFSQRGRQESGFFTSNRQWIMARRVFRKFAGGKVRGSSRLASVPTCVVLITGCSLSLGPTGTTVLTQPRSQHLGATFSTQVRLPREYSTIAGVEESLLGQPSPESRADQWRVALFGGYSKAPTAGGSGIGWEGALRAGFFRGSNGPLVPAGALLGAKFAAPVIRLSQQQEPWERGDLFDKGVWMLVPEVGFNTLWTRAQDFQLEATAMLALRYYISTTLLP